MREVAIVSPLRTAVGRFGGTLRDVPAAELGTTVVKALLDRTGVEPERVDDVIFGHAYPSGEEPALGRLVGLKAGLPIEVPGYQVDRRCGSGLQAVLNACMLVQTDNADVVIAGGAESMSGVEYYTTNARWGGRLGSVTLHDRLTRGRTTVAPEERFGHISGMIETAENVAAKYDIGRDAQDEYALRSHQRAVAGAGGGASSTTSWSPSRCRSARATRSASPRTRAPAPTPRWPRWPNCRPIMGEGCVTAGNASAQNDAGAACLVVAAEKLGELDLEPMGYLRGWATAGVHPAYMGMGPVPAVEKLSAKTGVTLQDADLIELNEAFAAQVLGVVGGVGSRSRTRRRRSSTSTAPASRWATPSPRRAGASSRTCSNEMDRRGSKYGIETMCIGGGQGIAALFERP